jgi:Ca2+-binding RTX toxin-like protein
MNDNWSWLVSQIPTWSALEGQAQGYIIDTFEYGYAFAPWQQDYFISTAVQAAEMGNQNAVTFLNWATNYIAGSVLNLGHDSINYVLAAFPNSVSWNGQIYWDSTTNAWAYAQPLQTWSAIEANTQIYGPSNGAGWSMSNGDYGADAMQALAGIISVTGSPEAMQAYAWLAGSGAPYTSAAAIQAQPQFDIVPKLPDGQLLTLGNLFTFDSTAPGIDQGAGTADQLIVEEGGANVTLQGGNGGINILANFGAGNDVLAGGDQGNYIFAGPGNDTVIGGAGANYLQAGTIVPASFYDGATAPASVPVATSFVLDTALAAQDTIAGFQPGTDIIDLVSGTGQPLSGAQIAAIISTATIDPAGDTVLQIGTDHSVTLSGIAPSALSPSFFLQADLTSADQLAPSNILTVGAGQEYATLAQAAAVVQSGDTIEIQAGTYTNDFASINGNVTIEGVGGTATFVATETPPNDKGILDLTGNITVDNLAFTGASVPASLGGNGAGIRYEGGNLVLNNDAFYGNQDGMLANPDPTGSIIINDSYFADNGSGTGYTHNLYVNEVGTLLINASTFTDAQVGHEIKSRALNTIITNSTIADGPNGTASYAIDLPNGGNATIVGNLIEKGPNSENPTMISAGEEGSVYANSTLTISDNTLLNDLASPSSLAVMNDTGSTATIEGNAIYGLTSAQIVSGPANVANTTVLASEPALPSLGASVQGAAATVEIGASSAPQTLTSSGNLIVGGATALTVIDQAGDNTVLGGAGGLTATAFTGDQIVTAAGAADTITLGGLNATLDSLGTDTISAIAGSNTIFAAGDATITTAAGTSNQITLAGNALVNSNGSDVIQLGAGNDTINASGAVTVLGGSGNVTINGGAGEVTFVAGSGTASLQGGAGALDVTAGSGNLTLTGGAGNDSFTAGTGNAVLNPGNGANTITLGSGGTTVNLGWGSNTFYLPSSHPGGTDIFNNWQIIGDIMEPVGYPNGLSVAKAWAVPTPSGAMQLNLVLTDNTHLAITQAVIQHY